MGIKKLPINVIIADGMMPIREYLRIVLSREADIKIIDTVGTEVEAVNRVLSAYPDVLLMDLDMIIPRLGVSAIKTILPWHPIYI
jgi:DNA-binding NarL/FixJ family response regulator